MHFEKLLCTTELGKKHYEQNSAVIWIFLVSLAPPYFSILLDPNRIGTSSQTFTILCCQMLVAVHIWRPKNFACNWFLLWVILHMIEEMWFMNELTVHTHTLDDSSNVIPHLHVIVSMPCGPFNSSGLLSSRFLCNWCCLVRLFFISWVGNNAPLVGWISVLLTPKCRTVSLQISLFLDA